MTTKKPKTEKPVVHEPIKMSEVRLTARRLVNLIGGPKVARVIKISTSMMPEHPPLVEWRADLTPAATLPPPPPPPPPPTIASMTKQLVDALVNEADAPFHSAGISYDSAAKKFTIRWLVAHEMSVDSLARRA